MEKNYTKPIIIGTLIIAIGLIASQYMKQESIERQARITAKAEQDAITAKATEERITENTRQINIDRCISTAYTNYSADWDSACDILNKGNDCKLPSYRANELDDRLAVEKKNCLNRY